MSANLRQLANVRLREVRALLGSEEYSGAYYLAGYAVELGLKAIITKNFRRYELPDKVLVAGTHTHDLMELIKKAQLTGPLNKALATDKPFAANWATVKDWKVTSRYELWTEQEARDLYTAVATTKTGVMKWVRALW